MRKAVRKLRLRQGDTIVVSDLTMAQQLTNIGEILRLGFDVPIIIVPPGSSLKRVCKEYILKKAKAIAEEFENTKEETNAK
jgi:hypothetical protein